MEPEKAKKFQKCKIVNFPSLDHGAGVFQKLGLVQHVQYINCPSSTKTSEKNQKMSGIPMRIQKGFGSIVRLAGKGVAKRPVTNLTQLALPIPTMSIDRSDRIRLQQRKSNVNLELSSCKRR